MSGGLLSREKQTLLLGMAGFAVVDQLSKWYIQKLLPVGDPAPLIPGVFQLTLAYNTGAAFSMLQHQPGLLMAITLGIFTVLLAYGLRRQALSSLDTLGLSLILGGALGNLIDRLGTGRVTDFLDVILIRYPVFNLADTFIFCGVLLLLWVHLRNQPGTNPEASSDEHRG